MWYSYETRSDYIISKSEYFCQGTKYNYMNTLLFVKFQWQKCMDLSVISPKEFSLVVLPIQLTFVPNSRWQ